MKYCGWFVLVIALLFQVSLEAGNEAPIQSKAAPVSSEGEKLLLQYLNAVIKLREVYYGHYKKDSKKFVNDFPQGIFINDEEEEFLRSSIELHGIAPMKIETYGVRVYADERMNKKNSFFVDFSRIWDKVIIVDGFSLPIDVSIKETFQGKVLPHARKRGLISSYDALSNFLIPSAHAGCGMDSLKGGMGAVSLITAPARLPIIGTNAIWDTARGGNPVSSILDSTGISGLKDGLGGIKDSITH